VFTVSLAAGVTVDSFNIGNIPGNWTWTGTAASSSLTISNTLAYDGGVVGRNLFFTNGSASNSLTLSIGAVDVKSGSVNFGREENFQPVTSVVVSGSTTIAAGARLLVRSGIAQFNGGVTSNGTFRVYAAAAGEGGVTVQSISGNGVVEATGVTSVNPNPTSRGVLTINGSTGTATFSGTLRNGAPGTVLSVVKNGSNTQILSGPNSYTGTTSVTAGTLLINGDQSLATGAVTVGANGTLGGTGIIGGATTIGNGTLSAGQSTGLLTFASSLTLNGDSTTAVFEINGSSRGVAVNGYDAVNVGGALSLDGQLVLNITTSLSNGSYDLFSFGGAPVGGFDAVSFTGGTYVGPFTETVEFGRRPPEARSSPLRNRRATS
jgi:autotransporter-associated beta strand protein